MSGESKLKKDVYKKLDELKIAGRKIKYVKYHGSRFSKANTPDLHVTLDGRSYWIELKDDGKEPTPGQEFELNEWAAAGAITGWSTTVAGVLKILGI